MKRKNLTNITYMIILMTSLICWGCKKDVTYKIGVSQCSSDDWRRKMNDEIMLEKEFYDGLEVEIRSADDSSARQIDDLQYFIDNHFDLIIVAPNEAEALTPKIKEIYNQGTPIIVFDRTINGDSYTAFQGADNAAIGRMAAQTAYKFIGENGKIIEIQGLPSSTPAQERKRGFDEEAKRLGMTIAGTGTGNWNATDAAKVTENLLRQNPDAQLIYAHNDRMAIAAREVADKMERKNLKIIGIDAAPTIGIQAVDDGVIDATFLYPTNGEMIIRTAMNILEGKPYEKTTILPSPSIVDKNNAGILLLQDQVIRDESEKISSLQGVINLYWEKQTLQNALLIGLGIIVLLLAGLIFAVLRAYWNNNAHRQQIERRNQELDTLYKQLQEATQSKLTFFTNVSHDLRTPLTLIADPVQQLSDATNLTPRQSTLMKLANKNVRILMRLINQILDIRKYDNGKLKLNRTNVDLSEALEEWSSSFANAAKKNHINFQVNVKKEDMTTAIDLDKIERVVFNLISNAFKFTPENGTIKIEGYSENHNIYIKVKDTGCGMSEQDIPMVFDRFFKTDAINPQGSGIGLALSKVFVEMHDGEITVDSKEGEGTTFTVSLPQQETEEGAMANITGKQVDINELVAIEDENIDLDPDSSAILVIDDNPDICTLIRGTLGEKYTVMQARNGQAGIRMASRYLPDMIICDVMMPGIDGFETCRRIKNEAITCHIPVLLLTACAQDSQRTEGYESGADGYMSKPFDSKMLIARCESMIANRKRIMEAAGKEELVRKDEKPAVPKNDIDNEFYNKFIEVVEESMGNSDLSVEDIAEKLGYSRVQMYRKLKAVTNYSPTELIRNCRLKRAAVMLKTTDSTISEIAYSVGFSSPSYFTKCYKEYFNESPSDTQSRTGKQ